MVFAQQISMGSADDPLGLSCSSGPHAAAWLSVKNRIRGLFKKDGSALVNTDRKVIADTLTLVNSDLREAKALSADSANECGIGRISLQLLTLTTVEPDALIVLFSSSEQLASPVLTLLLDFPWLAVAQSGWPIFGLLSELNLQKRALGVVNKELVDGLDKPVNQAFYNELMKAIATGDGAGVGQVTNMYLMMENEKNSLASLTALVAGAAGSTVEQRAQLMDATQNAMKGVIASATELDLALGTRWPLWGLMHTAVDVFAVV
eukprot:TRINITY_DN55499_c0_g1_i1.p1 TRINITY_DN55499_c0_g1~~TRINITY_DN55499_c0_g1_i1.p1  ORF type:complete len:306 (+),score=80.87 TRINITY_DN55499_c0_g1_i1:130-918(+)